jgi:hypothetical protein
MLAVLVAAVLAAAPVAGPKPTKPFGYQPYRKAEVDLVYNLLFCDDPRLFEAKGKVKPVEPLATALSKDASAVDLRRIADDVSVETRVRVLAYNQLRARKETVPERKLLGVIIEVPQPRGLDVLAAFVDGRMRYINQTGKMSVIETPTKPMVAPRDELLKVSAAAIERIGPWDKPRLPPPKQGNLRLTFLVSDGLYFGEGPRGAISRDDVDGPVVMAATELLMEIVAASLPPQAGPPAEQGAPAK